VTKDGTILERLRGALASFGDGAFVVLHGSRARGDARAESDWDFAFLSKDPAAYDAVSDAIASVVGHGAFDLADLSRAGLVLRHRVAQEGKLLAGDAEAWMTFQYETAIVWCDLEPILRPAFAEYLQSLK
jgi:uncharacterized protein